MSKEDLTYLEICHGNLLPQGFILVSAWKPHRCRVDDRVFCEQGFDVFGEGAVVRYFSIKVLKECG